MAVFDGDEFTEYRKKLHDEHEKHMFEIVRRALKKVVKKTYLKSILKKERKDMDN